MIELRKLLVFIFATSLFIYMLWINFGVLNKYGHKKLLSALMISGLGLISLGTFFDMIANFVNIKLGTLISICFTGGTIIFVIYIILWINHIVKMVSTLDQYAYSDQMTGVYNRRGFKQAFERKIMDNGSYYVMVFDLDKTKIINDNFGHLKGDQYIVNTARIIKDAVGQNGFIGRTGGDEFIAFLENIEEKEIEKIKIFIKDHVSQIFHKPITQVSIGYSRYKEDGETFEELMNSADKKMYEDKKNNVELILNKNEFIS